LRYYPQPTRLFVNRGPRRLLEWKRKNEQFGSLDDAHFAAPQVAHAKIATLCGIKKK
jgi:hypothetical protein